MLPNFLKYGLTLQAEIIAMVAEEIQTRAEDFIQKNADEGYEDYLAQLVNQVESTVDTLAKPLDVVGENFSKVTGQSEIPQALENAWQSIMGSLKREH